MSHIPVAKLIFLLVRTAAKPIAKELKTKSETNQSLKRFCLWIGQSFHKATTIINVRAAGFKLSSIKPLEESKALKIGGEVLSEGFIFSVAGGIVIYEYQSTAAKNAAKNAELKAEKERDAEQLKISLDSIHTRLDQIEHQVYGNKGIFGLGLGILGVKDPKIKEKLTPNFGKSKDKSTADVLQSSTPNTSSNNPPADSNHGNTATDQNTPKVNFSKSDQALMNNVFSVFSEELPNYNEKADNDSRKRWYQVWWGKISGK